jgi:uncharacterized protein YkwD
MKTLASLLLIISSLTLFGQADSTQQVMIDLLDDMRKRPFFYELSYNPIRTKLAHNDTLARVAMYQAEAMAKRESCGHGVSGETSKYLLYKEGMLDNPREGNFILAESCAGFVSSPDVQDCMKWLNNAGYSANNVTAHQLSLMSGEYSEVGMGYGISASNDVYICVILKK